MREISHFAKRYVYGLACSAYLFSGGVIAARNRGLLSIICKHFGLTDISLELPRAKLANLTMGDAPLRLTELTSTDGNATVLELVVLAKLVNWLDPRGLLEIGTFDGRTTLNLAANSSPDAKVYTLDLPRALLSRTKFQLARGEATYVDKELSGYRFHGTEFESKIVQLTGDSASFDFSPLRSKVDFIFIDGSHAYEYALNDSRIALDLLQGRRGLIVWHDYTNWEGVNCALNELFARDKEFKQLCHIEQTSMAFMPVNVASSAI